MKVCMLMALHESHPINAKTCLLYLSTTALFAQILERQKTTAIGTNLLDVMIVGSWNDTKGRTFAEVLDVYDQAIAIEIQKTVDNAA